MNTACHPCTTLPLTPRHSRGVVRNWIANTRAWWTRWSAPRQPQSTDSEMKALDGLTAETLKDIGAPEWVYERALRTQDRARQGGLFERDSLHWR